MHLFVPSLALVIFACVFLWVSKLLAIEVAPLRHHDVARYTGYVMGENLEVTLSLVSWSTFFLHDRTPVAANSSCL